MKKFITTYWESLLVFGIIAMLTLLNIKKLEIEVPEIIGIDKLAHFLMFYAFAFVLVFDSNKTDKKFLSPTLSFFIASTYGFVIELLQSRVGYRSFDLYDGLADALGALFGLVFYRFNKDTYTKILQFITNKTR